MNLFREINENGILYYRSDNIKARHGFSTRYGGVSTEPHLCSMNLGFGRGESDDNVRRNYSLFCNALGIDAGTLISGKQIHSASVLYADLHDAGFERFSCDGFVTDQKNVALCVKTADCVPILYCDKEMRAAAAVHAGWRGASAGIAAEAVRQMKKLCCDASDIEVAIGASIGACCYEVKEDFVESLKSTLGCNAEKYTQKRDGRIYADIVRINLDFLLAEGIPAENISINDKCTCCEPDRFFSHRASGGRRGTMAAIISL